MLHVALQHHPELRVCIEPLNTDCAGYDDTCRQIIMDLYGFAVPATGKIHQPLFATGKYLAEVEKHYDMAKVLYHHLNPDVLDHIMNGDIIHLVRRNHLAIAVSIEVARRKDLWHVESQEKHAKLDLTPVVLDIPRTIRQTQRLQIANQQFADHFTVYYEDMCEDWHGELTRIQEHLGVNPMAIDNPYVKSVNRPLEDMIANLDEVRASELAGYLNIG